MFQKVSEGLPAKSMFVRSRCYVTGDIFISFYDANEQRFKNEFGEVIVFGDVESRPDDEWRETPDTFMTGLATNTISGNEEPDQVFDSATLERLKSAARRKIVCIDLCNEDGTYNIDDWAGGNMDDAYLRGMTDGETDLARTILTAIGETW